MLYPGYERCGKLYLSHISFPPSLYDTEEIKVEINHPLELPERERDTHKGDYGKVLFIAGSSNYLGAPYFAALSFLKAGGGVSYLATPKSISSFLAVKGGEIVFLPQRETSFGSLSGESKDEILELSERAEMVVMGPGVSLNEETQRLVRELADMIKKPLLIDGDGITAIAKDLDIVKKREETTILTPHIGEMSRITGMDVDQINRDKIRVLQKTAKELKAIIVLKGAHSLIGYPDESVFINMSGNPGMATAGSGDILTGTIAAMLGLGLPIKDDCKSSIYKLKIRRILNATRIGVLSHGLSGDLAVQEKGEDGITAGDILSHLPNALKHYREDFNEISKNYGDVYVV
ncbi:MAG: putative carbohydrate kinase [Candidatus Methanolliviera sp. GoM_asphalt]|nr:MAG: putative carbohydrate kinase [Candidatus Methanolliviera sp. GoM_asphalt]